MKRYLTLLLLSLLVSAQVSNLGAQPMSDAEIIGMIRETPCRALGNFCPYISPEIVDTPAPSGFKPFYVSHLARHGSRYDIRATNLYNRVVKLLDTLHTQKLLTPEGDSLRTEIRHIRAAFSGQADGMLTDRGTREHMLIAANLYKRVPEVFSQQDRRKVQCTATMSARTIQSMAGFTTSLAKSCPGLDFELRSRNNLGINGSGDFDDPDFKVMSKEEKNERLNAVLKTLVPGEEKIGNLKARLFKEPSRVSPAQMQDIFETCSCACCQDIDINPLRFFTAEELFEFSKSRETTSCVNYGTVQFNASLKTSWGRKVARLLLDDADAAIRGNGRCADLRFSHDGTVGPLMFLLGFGPYSYPADENATYRNFQCSKSICMASNLQLIFYRSEKSGEILVKPIYNELEVNVPGLKPVAKAYYKWSELRRYILQKIARVDPLPEYYTKYLKQRARDIEKLQKDELDGFIFITDMHFPSNYGHAAAMIERLAGMVPVSRIVYGGDALTYLNRMSEGLYPQISALEQMKGVAPLYWLRGNHDLVNYTGKKPYITAERKALDQWDFCDVAAAFRGPDAVTDKDNPESAYYYYDSPSAKIRYLVFDTNDSVMDNKMVAGVSKPQLRFMANAAITAPEGYRIVYFSHVPLFMESEEKQAKSHAGARELINALEVHTVFDASGLKFDFSKRPDLGLLFGMCGHKHTDFITRTPGGTLQVNVEADCNYARQDAAGTLREQSFNYVSISGDGKSIRIVKLGDGEDRTFPVKESRL